MKQLRVLRELTAKYPQEKYAHVDLGRFFEDQGRARESVDAYDKAIALDPNFGFALNQAAYGYMRLGEMETAIEYFGRYAAVNPGLPNPLDSMAEAYMRMGKLDEAAAKYKEALAIKPDFYSTCGPLSYVFALKEDYPEALRWAGQFVDGRRRRPGRPSDIGF